MAMLEEAEMKKNKLAMESALRKENLLKSQKPQMAVPGSKLDTVNFSKQCKYLINISNCLQVLLRLYFQAISVFNYLNL